MTMKCPSDEELRSIASADPADAALEDLERHLEMCIACRARLDQLTDNPAAWAQAAQGETPPSSTRLREAMQKLNEETAVNPDLGQPPPPRPPWLQESSTPGMIGRLGSYEVMEEIARGGMGIVLKARDTGLDRIVAIKVLAPHLAGDAQARARFLREARAAAAVSHENVVTIHAVEDSQPAPFLVMEYVTGRTLARRLRTSGPLALPELLRIAYQTACGLAAAHRLGLVHRDIKPANIMLENSIEKVKLTDFGLSRAVSDTGLTQPGMVLGTPEYIAPEQAGGRAVDQRADLFSLGCVCYEMCTGHSPFAADTPLAALRKVCDETPPSARIVSPNTPAWLSDLIEGLLQKDPSRRPGSAEELAKDLGDRLASLQQQELLPVDGPKLRPPIAVGEGRRITRRKWLVAAGGAAGVLGVAGGWHLLRGLYPTAPSDPFLLRPASGASVGFESIADALRAARSGDVLELRVDGDIPIRPQDLGTRELTLRAADGHRPAIVATQAGRPILSTRATLVLEGITFKQSISDSPAAPSAARDVPILVLSDSASIFVTHCRFELGAAATSDGKAPACIQLINLRRGVIQNCEIYSTSGGGIQCLFLRSHGRRDGGRPPEVSLVVRDSVGLVRHAAAIVGRTPVPVNLSCMRNSFAGELFLRLSPQAERWSMHVFAERNVLDVQEVAASETRGERRPLRETMHWQGDANLFSTRDRFAGPPDNLAALADWVGYWAGAAQAARAAELDLAERMSPLIDRPEDLSPSLFRLDPGSGAESVGADLDSVGPGSPYFSWLRSAAASDWPPLSG